MKAIHFNSGQYQDLYCHFCKKKTNALLNLISKDSKNYTYFFKATCQNCHRISIYYEKTDWNTKKKPQVIEQKLIFPVNVRNSEIPQPVSEMPDGVKDLYNQAAKVYNVSLRACNILLRVALEKWLKDKDGVPDAQINQMKKEYIKKYPGANNFISIIQYVGNINAHANIDKKEENFKLLSQISNDKELTLQLFDFLNFLCQEEMKNLSATEILKKYSGSIIFPVDSLFELNC